MGINIQSVTDVPNYEAHKRMQRMEWERRRTYIKELFNSSKNTTTIDNPNTVKEEFEIMKIKAGYHA